MQAVILVGGEGTRLRPLTSTVPKPVVPLVDRPFIAYMLEWLRRHGVDDVIMSCGFLATGVRDVLGDGSQFGLRLRFVEEPEPRGTAGALKFAEELLDERFLMLNGDVLTDLDLTAQIAQHEATGATGTLALVPVADPSSYGLVRLRDGPLRRGVPREAVARRDRHEPHLRRRLRARALGARPDRARPERLDRARGVAAARRRRPLRLRRRRRPTGSTSARRARYLQGTFDILEGNVETEVAERLGGDFLAVDPGATVDGRVVPPAVVERGARIAARRARRQPRRARRGRQHRRGLDGRAQRRPAGARIGASCVLRDCIVCPGRGHRRPHARDGRCDDRRRCHHRR